MSKVISLVGAELGDFAYYLAVILSRKSTVMFIDNSFNGDVFNAVSDFDYERRYIVKQNIVYGRALNYKRKEDSDYDFVIIWHGLNISTTVLTESDSIYVLPDYTPYCISRIKNCMTGANLRDVTNLFMRNSVESNKISEKTVLALLEIDGKRLHDIIPFDAKDYENYLAFLYNGRQTFAHLSPSFYSCLIKCVMNEYEMDRKGATKLVNKAKS